MAASIRARRSLARRAIRPPAASPITSPPAHRPSNSSTTAAPITTTSMRRRSSPTAVGAPAPLPAPGFPTGGAWTLLLRPQRWLGTAKRRIARQPAHRWANPFEGLAWIANHLAERGRALSGGDNCHHRQRAEDPLPPTGRHGGLRHRGPGAKSASASRRRAPAPLSAAEQGDAANGHGRAARTAAALLAAVGIWIGIAAMVGVNVCARAPTSRSRRTRRSRRAQRTARSPRSPRSRPPRSRPAPRRKHGGDRRTEPPPRHAIRGARPKPSPALRVVVERTPAPGAAPVTGRALARGDMAVYAIESLGEVRIRAAG